MKEIYLNLLFSFGWLKFLNNYSDGFLHEAYLLPFTMHHSLTVIPFHNIHFKIPLNLYQRSIVGQFQNIDESLFAEWPRKKDLDNCLRVFQGAQYSGKELHTSFQLLCNCLNWLIQAVPVNAQRVSLASIVKTWIYSK